VRVLAMSCLLLLSFIPLHAIDIYLAPISTMTDEATLELAADEKRFGEMYFEAIVKADSRNLLQVKALDKGRLPAGKEIRSTMDALEICEALKIDYLIFGFYKKSFKTIEAEIRIFDKEKKDIRKTFYAKAERDESTQVRDDLAQRFVDYMYSIIGIDVKKTIPKVFRGFGGLELNGGVGYWTPLGNWFDVYTGIVKADIGLMIHPEEELFWIGDFLFMYRFGIFLEYRMGLTKPDIELSSLHSAKATLPFEVCVLFLERHAAYLGVSLFYQHDFIYQVRIYGSNTWLNSGTLGAGAKLGYENWIGDARQTAFGAAATFDVSFYQNISTQLSLSFYFKYRFPFQGKPTQAEEKQP
jgi:hypothetical protein